MIHLQGLKESNAENLDMKKFCLRNGVLYRVTDDEQRKKHQLAVPPNLRNDILEACHFLTTREHFGVYKTKVKVTERYSWPTVTNYMIS